jgi:hypothetical protein
MIDMTHRKRSLKERYGQVTIFNAANIERKCEVYGRRYIDKNRNIITGSSGILGAGNPASVGIA